MIGCCRSGNRRKHLKNTQTQVINESYLVVLKKKIVICDQQILQYLLIKTFKSIQKYLNIKSYIVKSINTKNNHECI